VSQYKNEYRPSFTKIEGSEVRDPIAEYILAKRLLADAYAEERIRMNGMTG
jgi:hypothetical protein